MKARPTWTDLVATIAVHPRQMRALAAYRFDANRMQSVKMPTLLLVGAATPSPYAKQSIAARRESLPNPTLVVLENQEHNAMDGGREVLANAIIKFAAAQEREPAMRHYGRRRLVRIAVRRALAIGRNRRRSARPLRH
jgi:pimeloyl-ACP methyl ester carboxylesterase